MIEGYNVKDQMLGTGDTNAYTFSFKIYDPTHLLIYVQDLAGNIIQQIRGDDTAYLSGIVFDPVKGGGTVTLLNNFDNGFTMTLILAPDLPSQPSSFSSKGSFTLSAFEGALDYLAILISRIAWLSQRSVRMHDLDDQALFDPTLPPNIALNPNAVLAVDPTGTKMVFGATTTQIVAANGYALAAASSATASANSAAASAASAAAAAAASSGAFVQGTKAAPLVITAIGGITPQIAAPNQPTFMYLHASGGAIVISKNPAIAPGANVGQMLTLIGVDDINTVTVPNGLGTSQNGDIVLGLDDAITYAWDGTNWSELSRRR